MKERIKWIDNARGVCLFCVLLAHSDVEHPILHTFYSPWFLTLFFYISGYLFSTRSLKEDIVKIIKHLLLPYFLLSFLLFFIGIDNWTALFNSDMDFLRCKIEYILIGKNLWFIPCIAVVQIYYVLLAHTFMKTLKRKIFVCILLFFSVFFIENKNGYVAPYCSDIAVFATAYFLLGNVVRNIIISQKVPESIRKIIFLLCKTKYSILTLVIYACLSFYVQGNINMEFHFANNFYSNPTLFILLSLIGMFAICLFSNIVSLRLLRLLGENSLAAFAFNGKAYAISIILLSSVRLQCQELFAIILSLTETVILLFFAYMINKFLPWLVGKYK